MTTSLTDSSGGMRSAREVPVNPILVRRSKTSTSPSREPSTSAVPDVGNVVVGIEKAVATAIENPNALSAHQMERPVIEQRRACAQQALATHHQVINFVHGR